MLILSMFIGRVTGFFWTFPGGTAERQPQADCAGGQNRCWLTNPDKLYSIRIEAMWMLFFVQCKNKKGEPFLSGGDEIQVTGAREGNGWKSRWYPS